jgi:hypothetical protein
MAIAMPSPLDHPIALIIGITMHIDGSHRIDPLIDVNAFFAK